jgi:cell division protease FtsH
VGLGVEKIKKMFDNARKKAAEHGRAIIFFDEIDSIGAARSSYRSVSTDDAMYTLNELLTQMDGFKTTQGVFVVGATNRKDILDPALLRPGRFEFISDVPFPDAEDRDSILRLYLKNMRHAVSNSAIQRAVKGTQGLAADHLKGLVNLSGIKAVRAGNNVVRDEHFLQATDDICQQSGMKEDLSKYIL